MEELKDLNELENECQENYKSHFIPSDIVLPDAFKERITTLDGNDVQYNKFTAIVTTSSQNLKIYLPNQWFYIASFFTDLYIELTKYQKAALDVLGKDYLKNNSGKPLTTDAKNKISSLNCSDDTKRYLGKFVSDYNWWNGGKSIDRHDFYISPIVSLSGLVNSTQSYVATLCMFLAKDKEAARLLAEYSDKNSESYGDNIKMPVSGWEQTIYYGTPGSGKSHFVKERVEKSFQNQDERDEHIIRTTFHPDSDYSTFVGAYKPVVEERDGGQKITYQFTPQAFVNAYVRAWLNTSEPYYLVIEEINRGNCAEIFGDLFQLLDRDDNGFSEYPIQADEDLKRYLIGALGEAAPGIKNGRICLPPNLSLIATMNTSDQSLFPMDSAFKRRWSWVYVPTGRSGDKSETFKINIGHITYMWHDFQKIINGIIKEKTSSEDKQMGNFFIKHDVDEEEFKGKIMFYLWSEICKENYGTQDNFFKCFADEEKNEREFSFNELYEGESTKIIQDFMEINHIKPAVQSSAAPETADKTE